MESGHHLALTCSVSSLVPASSIEGLVLILNNIYAEFNFRDFFHRQGKLLKLQREIDCRGSS